MKWHNFGTGKVQFRLCVVIVETDLNDKKDKSEMARMKIKIQKIIDGTFIYRGSL